MKFRKLFSFSTMALCWVLFASQALAAKKVLIVHSYHAEYDWCQGVNEGIDKVLKPAGIETRTFYMDTKRNSSQEWKEKSGQAAEVELNAYNPDVLITVDDDTRDLPRPGVDQILG